MSDDQRHVVLTSMAKDTALPLPGLLVLVRETPSVATDALDGDYVLSAFGVNAELTTTSAAGMVAYAGANGHVKVATLEDSAGRQLTAGGAPSDVFDFSTPAVDGSW